MNTSADLLKELRIDRKAPPPAPPSRRGLWITLGVVVALLVLDWRYNFSAVLALMAPVILIGGMTMGWFTPTEAAVAAVLWSAVFAWLWRGGRGSGHAH